MRDLIITLVVLGSLPMAFKRPWFGLVVWAWLGYMNPHRLAWGFAYSFPFVQAVAAVTLAGIFFSKEQKRFPLTPVTTLWMLWILWMTLSTLLAMVPVNAWPEWERMIKIQIMVLVTLLVITDRQRIDWLVWCIVVSIGFFGTKGGVFTLATGGNYLVWGPPGSFIEGNNELALALLTIVPLMRYLHMQSTHVWVKRGLIAAMMLCIFSIVGSYSRGAFLGGIAMLGLLWWRSSNKFAFGAPIVAIALLAVLFMPSQWMDRMNTIQTYEQDGSAMGRITAWTFAFNLAKDHPFLGGGYNIFWDFPTYEKYAPNPEAHHDAHSIYFEVLGEQGFFGLAIFLALSITTLVTAQSVIRRARTRPDLKWAGDLAGMLQVSFFGFAVGGAFLGLAYFDLPYHLMSIVVMLGILSKLPAPAVAPQEANDTVDQPVMGAARVPVPYVTSRAVAPAAPTAARPGADESAGRPNPYGATMRGGHQP